jgi:hypothetical protein
MVLSFLSRRYLFGFEVAPQVLRRPSMPTLKLTKSAIDSNSFLPDTEIVTSPGRFARFLWPCDVCYNHRVAQRINGVERDNGEPTWLSLLYPGFMISTYQGMVGRPD